MKEKSMPGSAIFKIRVLLGLVFFFAGICLTLLATSNPQQDAPVSPRSYDARTAPNWRPVAAYKNRGLNATMGRGTTLTTR